jgi:hypothetical protein
VPTVLKPDAVSEPTDSQKQLRQIEMSAAQIKQRELELAKIEEIRKMKT